MSTPRPSSCAATPGPGSRQRLAVYDDLAEDERQAYADRLEFELDVITGMGFPGYFLIVADFIKWAKEQGIPVGPGPRLGRRLGGRLVADHHRSRSDPARPAVRALPQPRARLDAGLRHRLLRNAARRGDPLRPGALGRRPGRPDHHLREAEGPRRAQGHRPRPANALRPGRPARQADPQPSDRSLDAGARAERRLRARRRISERRRRSAACSIWR